MQNFTIQFNPDSNIEDAKAVFSRYFPYLKWEFFAVPHIAMQGNPKKEMIKDNPKMEELTKIQEPISISFTGHTTVQELEQQMEDQLGLHIQVFRRSGNIWLETTVTDEWTLSFQNEQGKELSEQFDRKK